jgi:hypothetical protein
MEIVDRQVVSAGVPGTSRAVSTFPAFVVLADGSLLLTYSIGSGKDTDDLDIELRRSTDGGRTWTEPVNPFSTTLEGRRGSLKAAPITRLDGDHLIVAALWIDREAFPGQPLFNHETEGCLPMTVVLADSTDAGRTWTPWRIVPMPDDVGPPSLTNAILRLADGTLVLSIESNKPYLDRSKWFQRVVHLRSSDGGATWSEPVTVLEDPTGRILNWDQRGAIAPDGRLLTVTWTYDSDTASYLNVRRRISADGIAPFGPADDLGFADQPGHPAILPDGRVVVAWVDRFGTASIRARQAAAIDAPFAAASEVVVHRPDDGPQRTAPSGSGADDEAVDTKEILIDMGTWSYGLAFAEALPDGDVGVVHYAAGIDGATDVRWVRLRLDP